MATKVAVATISNMFRDANYGSIRESAYYLWEKTFCNVSGDELEQAAWNLIRNRSQYKTGQVRLDEITRELRDMGIQVYHRKEDPAFVAAYAALEERSRKDSEMEGVSLAVFRETDENGGQAIQAFLKEEV